MMGLHWWVLVCEAVLRVSGTTTAPAASESSGHMVVALVVSSDSGTRAAPSVLAAATMPGGTPAHFSSEEPITNFTLRLPDGFPGETALHQETVGPLLVQEKVPWYEVPCHTMKRLLLAGLALVGSVLVVATLGGGLLGLALATWCLGGCQRGQQRPRQQPKQQCPFHAELQSVVRALALRESEKEDEVGPDYRSLAQDLV